MLIRTVAVLFGLAGWLSPAAAQVSPYDPSEGFVSGLRAPASVAFSRCITELDIDHVGDVVDFGCSVVDSVSLESVAGPPVWMLKYRRSIALDYEEFVDTLTIDELVLVRGSPVDTVEALWHLTRIQTYEFLERVESVESNGGTLVSYLTCLNGTGGCAQHFLFGRGTWEVVAQPYLRELEEFLPKNSSLHKGRRIDLDTLRGTQPITSPGDANCCPSGMIEFAVELSDGALHLVSATVSGDT